MTIHRKETRCRVESISKSVTAWVWKPPARIGSSRWPLFSEISTDWSHWNGQPVPGMGLIKGSALLVRVFLVLCMNIMVMTTIGLVMSLYSGKRQFFLSHPPFRCRQMVYIGLSAAMTALITGIGQMKYFFLTSVFPFETEWLGGVVIYGSVLLLFSALMPMERTA